MAEKKLNEGQQKAVDIDLNGVITAGAGSGKTTVLALRFLRLVKEKKAGVDEILTLTFTRKAAAEMYARIHKHFSENQDIPAIKDELARFELAQISTLDSFCSQIVRGDCAAYGIPNDFRLDKAESDRMTEETALEFLLSRRDDPSMTRFLMEYGFRRLLQEVWVPLGVKAVSLAMPVNFPDLALNQFSIMKEMIRKCIEAVSGAAVIVNDMDPSSGKLVVNARAAMGIADNLEQMAAGEEWEKLGEAFFHIGKIRMPGSNAKKTDLVELRDILTELRPLSEQASGSCAVLSNSDHIFHTAELASDFQEVLIGRKRSSGLLSFQDVVELAVEILKNNLSMRNFYKQKFKYIMIDEFQDNNRLQKELLFLLAERDDIETAGLPAAADLSRKKLYFVGDEKQSIYRFRGADVSVFKGLSNELESCGGKKITLDTNYRSEPGLIGFFNRIFPAIMGSGIEDYEAGFLELKSRPSRLKEKPVIKLFYSGKDFSAEELSGHETEAFYLAKFIKESVESRNLQVFRDGGTRAVEWDDFALLFRSGSNQFIYEKYFRNMGIPYDVADVRSLFMEAPANDIYLLLQLAVYPEDRNAYAGLLRSPFINLGDDSMVSLMLEESTEPFSPESESYLVREEDRRKFSAGRDLYRGAIERIDRISHCELIRWIWYDRGYRFTLLRNPYYHHYLEYYDYLSALAGSADDRGLTLAGFLDEMRPNLGKNTKLDELTVLKKAGTGVRIMTIHASKGLEFPVTILADCGSVGRGSSEKGASCYFHPETGISLKLEDRNGRKMVNPVYASLEKDEKLREFAELKRLLYVALTRSQCHLILAGRHTKNNKKELNNLLNLFLSGFNWSPGVEPESIPGLDDILVPLSPVTREESMRFMKGLKSRDGPAALEVYRKAVVSLRKIQPLEYPVTGWIHGPEAGEKPSMEVESGGISPEGQQLFDWTGSEELPAIRSDEFITEKGIEALFGTLCHLIMEEYWSDRIIPGRLESLVGDLPKKEFRQLMEDGKKICGLFLATSFARELKDNYFLESEVSFLMRKEDILLRGQIDLLARSKLNNEIRVIDFKTDRIKHPISHKAQLEIYAEAVKEMEDTDKISAFICYLRDGSVEEVDVR